MRRYSFEIMLGILLLCGVIAAIILLSTVFTPAWL